MQYRTMNAHLLEALGALLKDLPLSFQSDQEKERALRADLFLAGGALLSLLEEKKPHDYDLFCRSPGALQRWWPGARLGLPALAIDEDPQVPGLWLASLPNNWDTKTLSDWNQRNPAWFLSHNALTHQKSRVQLIFRFLGKTVFQYTGKFTAVLVIVGGFLCLVSAVVLAWSHLP